MFYFKSTECPLLTPFLSHADSFQLWHGFCFVIWHIRTGKHSCPGRTIKAKEDDIAVSIASFLISP